MLIVTLTHMGQLVVGRSYVLQTDYVYNATNAVLVDATNLGLLALPAGLGVPQVTDRFRDDMLYGAIIGRDPTSPTCIQAFFLSVGKVVGN